MVKTPSKSSPEPMNNKKTPTAFARPVTVFSNSQVNCRCPWANCERSSLLKLLRQLKTKFMSSILDRENQKLTVSRSSNRERRHVKINLNFFSSEPYYELYRLRSRHLRLIGIVYVYREKTNKAGCSVCLFKLMLYVPVNG